MGQDIAAGRIEHQLGLKLRCSPAGTGTCVEVIEPPTALMPEVWSPDSPKERACGGKILEGDILMTVGQIFVNRMPLDELQNLLLGPPGSTVQLGFMSARQKSYTCTLTRGPDPQDINPIQPTTPSPAAPSPSPATRSVVDIQATARPHVHFRTEQAEVHEIPSSYIGSDSDEDAGNSKALNPDMGTEQVAASLICGDSDEDDSKGNTDVPDKKPTTTARSLIDLDGSLIHDGIRTRMRYSTRGAGQDAKNESRAQGATRHRSPPPIRLGSPEPSSPLSSFEPSDEDAATSDEGPRKQDEEEREQPLLEMDSLSAYGGALGTRLGLEGLEGGGMGESTKGGFNQSCRLSGKMLSKGVIEDVYPPFDAQVERFVKVSGGGHGVYFGELNIFALGVIKRSASNSEPSTKWLRQPSFSTSKGARVQKSNGSAADEPTSPNPKRECSSRDEKLAWSIFVPQGFGGGRELRYLPLTTRDLSFSEFLVPPGMGTHAFGRVNWDPKRDPALYVRIPKELLNKDLSSPENGKAPEETGVWGVGGLGGVGEGQKRVAEDFERECLERSQRRANWALPKLLSYFVQKVWNLEKPQMFISIIGSSFDFDMNDEDRIMLLNQLMTVAKETNATVATLGLDVGLSRYVGEAKRAVEADINLVGICPWGMVEGRQALWAEEADRRVLPMTKMFVRDNFAEYEKQFRFMTTPKTISAPLNREHTHFVLIDDGSEGIFGGETATRMAFEMAVQQWGSDAQKAHEEAITKVLLEKEVGWQGTRLSNQKKKKKDTDCMEEESEMVQDEFESHKEVIALCVCVQGGVTTVRKVHESVFNGTPVLLVKGSGKAADLIADCVICYRHLTRTACHGSGVSDEFSRTGSGGSRSSSHASAMPDPNESGFLSPERYELLQRLHMNDPDDEWLQSDIQKMYSIDFKKDFDQMTGVIQAICERDLCEVYDMHAQAGDLSGSMLMAAIRWQRKLGKAWHEVLNLAVAWNHEGILRNIMGRLRTSDRDTKESLHSAFNTAFLENKVSLCRVFMDYTNCMLAYSLRDDLQHWNISIGRAFAMFSKRKVETSKVLNNWTRMAHQLLEDFERNHLMIGPGMKRWGLLYEEALKNEAFRKLCHHSGATTSESLLSSVLREASKVSVLASMSSMRESKTKGEHVAIKAFERVLKYILGENWWYETCCMGPEFDVFLWALLLQRHDMAIFIWSKLEDSPVRTALLAATIHRRWAALPDVKPQVAASMLENAQAFESVAVEVQLLAMRDDPARALESLEIMSRLWKGQTGVDLALLGGCTQFVENCCVQALDHRWGGDIHPYNQCIGLYPSVIVCAATGGLFTRSLIEFRQSPRAEAVRSPGQRTPIRHHLLGNLHHQRLLGLDETFEVLFTNLQKAMSSREKCVSDEHMLALSDRQLLDMSISTDHVDEDIPWTQRINLFYMSPVTIFVLDAILQLTESAVFMIFLLSTELHRSQLFWTEYVMAVVQLSALITEFFQLLLDGPASYFEVKWNWIKCFVIIFFWMGFWDIWARVKNAEICASSEEACAQASVKDAHITAFLKAASTGWGQDKTAESCAVWASCAAAGSSTGNNGRDAEFGHTMYSLSLCFMWLRVLRLVSVNKDLGPLVVVVGRMGRDMCVFGVIWIVLLLAFSSALYGTMMHEDFSASSRCQQEGSKGIDGGDFVRMRCWSTWWLVRTYYQAFGQPFFEDLTTDESNILTMMMWPVMNLVLVNLLIAIMNDSYTDVKDHSKLEWMIEMLNLAKEYRSPSRLNALLLFYDVFSFVSRKREIDARLSKLVGEEPKHLFGWIEQNRFTFKKFLNRDIPPVPAKEQQDAIDALLKEIELDDQGKENNLEEALQVHASLFDHDTIALLAKASQIGQESPTWIQRVLRLFDRVRKEKRVKKRLKTTAGKPKLQRKQSVIDQQFSSANTERKTVLKRKRAQLTRQQKNDIEEIRRCAEFLRRAKAAYLKESANAVPEHEKRKEKTRGASRYSSQQVSRAASVADPFSGTRNPFSGTHMSTSMRSVFSSSSMKRMDESDAHNMLAALDSRPIAARSPSVRPASVSTEDRRMKVGPAGGV